MLKLVPGLNGITLTEWYESLKTTPLTYRMSAVVGQRAVNSGSSDPLLFQHVGCVPFQHYSMRDSFCDWVTATISNARNRKIGDAL